MEKEVTMEELIQFIHNKQGDFIIHVELGEEKLDAEKE